MIQSNVVRDTGSVGSSSEIFGRNLPDHICPRLDRPSQESRGVLRVKRTVMGFDCSSGDAHDDTSPPPAEATALRLAPSLRV